MIGLFVLLLTGEVLVSAQTETKQEIDSMNDTIKEKQQNIEVINQKIADYRKKIQKKEAEEATLKGELELLDNRIAKTALEIEETKEQIDLINTEILMLNRQLGELETKMEEQRKLLINVIQVIQTQDDHFPIKTFFGAESLSELFDEFKALQTINHELKQTLDRAQATKEAVEEKKAAQQTKQTQLQEKESSLLSQKDQLEEIMWAQEFLIAETQRSEAVFRTLVQELKQEQSVINQQVAALQKEIESRLLASDKASGPSVITWPLGVDNRRITALFHDPSYPYRHLFEHSGLDLGAYKGAPVLAAAPGYVAWARTGRLYGNYVMIIHTNGLSTLYAHLSRMDVKADQYIERGQVIGAVGSTGLSTGPHLHFEVREDGIPRNPLNYLTE